MFEMIIPEPCRNCQGIYLAVEQRKDYFDYQGHLKHRPLAVRCVHERICYKLREPVDDERKLAESIANYLDAHPDKAISVSMHMVGGEWMHTVSIEDKKIGKF